VGAGGVPNPPSTLVIRTEISVLWSIPDHQQGGASEGNGADDALIVD